MDPRKFACVQFMMDISVVSICKTEILVNTAFACWIQTGKPYPQLIAFCEVYMAVRMKEKHSYLFLIIRHFINHVMYKNISENIGNCHKHEAQVIIGNFYSFTPALVAMFLTAMLLNQFIRS